MFYQSFFSPQVKRCAIISYKHGAYKLTHAFRSDNPIILKSLRVILPQKRKTSNFHPRSVHTPNKKEPQNHQFAHRQNAPPEPPMPKTGQMAPRPPKAIMSPPHQRQDKWPPPPSARSCTPPRKYPYTTNRNNIPEPTYAPNTKQTNDGIFSNRAGENFKLAITFLNVRVRL